MGLYEEIVEKIRETDVNMLVNGLFTLGGTIVGSAITLFSQRGRIRLSMTEPILKFSIDKGFPVQDPHKEGAFDYINPRGQMMSMECRLDIINTSALTIPIRNLNICIVQGNKIAWEYTFGSALNLGSQKKESLQTLNMQPHELKSFHIFTGDVCAKTRADVLCCDRIYVSYTNKKDKLKKTKVYSGNISLLDKTEGGHDQ